MTANPPPSPRATRLISTAGRRLGVRGILSAAAAMAAGALTAPRAAAQTWVGPGGGVFNGSFQTASNWSPATVPAAASTAVFNLGQNYTVTFSTNVTTSNLVFSNSTGVTTFGGAGVTRTYTVGNTATFTGGTAALANLNLVTPGVLAVRGGNLLRVLGASSVTTGIFSVGDTPSGLASTVSVEGNASQFLVVGRGTHVVGSSGDTGSLTFSNSAAGDIGGTLALADDASASASATGNLKVLSGAALTVFNLRGATGASRSPQTAAVTVQGAGSSLTVGGSLTLGAESQGAATFDVLAGGTANLQTSPLTLDGTATMTVDGGTITASGLLRIDGLLTVTNGARFTHTPSSFGGPLSIGTGPDSLAGTPPALPSTVNVGGASTQFTADGVKVGTSTRGTFNQSGGAVLLTGITRIGSNTSKLDSGLYTLSGGTLNTAEVAVAGNTSDGTFTQSGGTHTVSTLLRVAANTGGGTGQSPPSPPATAVGAYTLSGGKLSAPTVWVGNTATGVVNHSGGSLTVAGELTLGGIIDSNTIFVGESNASGAYNLSGTGTLAAATQRVGWSAVGTFTQTGGTNTVSAQLIVGDVGAGSYSIAAGALTTPILKIGNGSVKQSGGTVTVGQAVNVATGFASDSGLYELAGGTLNAPTLALSSKGEALLELRGGVANVTTLIMGGDQGTQRATAVLTAGTLHTSVETVGRLGDARFIQGGGTNVVDARLTIGAPASPNPADPSGSGEYSLLAGTLSAAEIVVEGRGLLSLSGVNTRLESPNLVVRGGFVTAGNSTPTLAANATFAPTSAVRILNGLNLTGTVTLERAAITGAGTLGLDTTARLKGSGDVYLNVTNTGTIEADAGSLVLRGATLLNTGTLRNAPGANLFVKATSLTNNGNVAVNAGGSVAFDRPLSINSGKTLTVAGGTLAAPLLTNSGAASGFGQLAGDLDNFAAATFNGPTQIIGNFTNRPGGTLTVRNDQTLITGLTTNNGTITTLNGKVIFDGGLAASPLPAPATGLLTSVSNSPAAASPDSPSVTLTGASALITPFLRQQSLSLNGTAATPATVSIRPRAFGGQTSVLTALSIPTTANIPVGRLDLADTSLVVDYGATDPSPLATIRDLVTAGFHNGDWLGNGLTSSAAALDRTRALGYANAASVLTFVNGSATFAGVTVDPSAVLVRYTLGGDATLDGVVNFDDLLALAKNYNATAAAWPQGDYNYDATVNFDDLLILAKNYNKAQPTAPLPGTPADFAGDLAAAFAQVPEPSTALAAATAACGFALSTRRRRPLV
jgi:T5SS/PEP-CTERM-associated repeat protein